MSVGEVKAALRAAIEATHQGLKVFDQASAEAKTATAAAEAIMNDSRDEDVRAVLQALAAASAEVEPTRRRFLNTTEHTTRYLKQLG